MISYDIYVVSLKIIAPYMSYFYTEYVMVDSDMSDIEMIDSNK